MSTKTIWIATVFSLSLFFRSFLHKGSLPLYNTLWTILILHLLTIWTLTWVPVPSDIFPDFLWVVVATAALFRSLLHINAVRKVATGHLMRWWQLSFRYFWVFFVLVYSWGMSLSLGLLGGSFQLLEYVPKLYSTYLRRSSFSDHFHSFLTHEILNWDS